MQKRTKLFLGAGAAAMLALGGLAGLAQADMDGPMGGGMGGGMCGFGHGRGPGMMARQMMERYDTNKDGKVTQAEIDQTRQKWLAEFDTDKDGSLSLDEFKQLWIKSHNEMMVREFQFFDHDGDGKVTLDEYKEPSSDLVANRDRNNDGSLGRDDRPNGDGDGPGWRRGRGMMGQGQGMMGQGYGMMGQRRGMMGGGNGPCMDGGDGPQDDGQDEGPSGQ